MVLPAPDPPQMPHTIAVIGSSPYRARVVVARAGPDAAELRARQPLALPTCGVASIGPS